MIRIRRIKKKHLKTGYKRDRIVEWCISSTDKVKQLQIRFLTLDEGKAIIERKKRSAHLLRDFL